MADDALRVAVIGHTGRGDWGHAIDELWMDVDGTTIVAAADADDAGLVAAGKRHSLAQDATFRDWKELFTKAKPDIVAICSRYLDGHAEMAIAAAEAGARGIFIEKPFVATPAEADAVIAACEKNGTKLQVAMVNRHAATIGAVRDLVEDGKIGKLLELRARGKEDARGGGQDLVVLGCHVLDLMTSFGGAPQWCQATATVGGRLITKADAVDGPEGIGLIAGDSIAAMFGLADGPVGYFASTREAGLKQPAFGLTLVGSAGAIHIRPDHVPQAFIRRGPLWRTDKEIPWQPIGPEGIMATATPLSDAERSVERASWGRRAVADLLDAIQNDREPETGMYAGRTIVEMNAAIFASALSGQRITWPLAQRANPLS
jgi:predicted dehydrogenase